MLGETWNPSALGVASPFSSSSPASDTRLEGRRDTARDVALLLITEVAREVAIVLILVTSFTLQVVAGGVKGGKALEGHLRGW
jgi:hypothetical protein